MATKLKKGKLKQIEMQDQPYGLIYLEKDYFVYKCVLNSHTMRRKYIRLKCLEDGTWKVRER